MTIQEILSRLEGVKGGSGQWVARCSGHSDTHQSLSVAVGTDGRVLLNCHAGCTAEAITAALGLRIADLFVDKPRPERSPVAATYDYRDSSGQLLAQKLRRADKSFIWRRPDGHGGWIYNRKGLPPLLYVAGTLSGAVLVCEG